MHTNPYIVSFLLSLCSSKYTCTTDLTLLQKKALGTLPEQNNSKTWIFKNAELFWVFAVGSFCMHMHADV